MGQKQAMNKIDIHTHILPAELPSFKDKYGYGGFIVLEHHKPDRARMLKDDGQFFREIEANCFDPKVRLQEMDKLGVNVQVLSTVPVMFSYWAKPEHALDMSRFLNDHIAQVVSENPRRFAGLGTLPMQSPDLAVKELERCVKELKLAGVQIGSHIKNWNLSDQELFPVFEAAEALGASIFVHPWDMMGQDRMPKYWLPWLVGMPAEVSLAICSMIFGGVFEKFPKLRVAFAHGGGAFCMTLGRIEHGFLSRPDLCGVDNNINPRQYRGRFFVDSLVHDPGALRYVIDVLGETSVALGSDYPFPLGEAEPGAMIESMPDLMPANKHRLLCESALHWLDKKHSDFELPYFGQVEETYKC